MTGDLVGFLVENGRLWIAEQRERLRPGANPLSVSDRRALTGYFSTAILDASAVTVVDEIQNPPFYAAFGREGLAIPLDFRTMTGITFVDTIAVSRSRFAPGTPWLPLLFHELVHVLQYRLLGLDRFVNAYVNGWAENGFSYPAIPLEAMAYELENRYLQAASPFLVDAEVQLRLGDEP